MSTSWDGDREEYDTVPLYVLWNAPGLYYLTVIFPGKSYTLTVLLVRRIFSMRYDRKMESYFLEQGANVKSRIFC